MAGSYFCLCCDALQKQRVGCFSECCDERGCECLFEAVAAEVKGRPRAEFGLGRIGGERDSSLRTCFLRREEASEGGIEGASVVDCCQDSSLDSCP